MCHIKNKQKQQKRHVCREPKIEVLSIVDKSMGQAVFAQLTSMLYFLGPRPSLAYLSHKINTTQKIRKITL